jgi:uncharacterized Zn finger protein (UPF0148 family)
MKQIVCEMCGGKELLKQDGVFVCQSCGTKYSAEDDKKMMVEINASAKSNVPDEVRGVTLKNGSSKFDNQAQWARQYLVYEGLVDWS